jgi:hypothetical protein
VPIASDWIELDKLPQGPVPRTGTAPAIEGSAPADSIEQPLVARRLGRRQNLLVGPEETICFPSAKPPPRATQRWHRILGETLKRCLNGRQLDPLPRLAPA